ncbi:MAG TPA: peptidase S8, partial [Bacteroidetes bacterium]|nr:peptidase S8 [Bacteroidota bacterium]
MKKIIGMMILVFWSTSALMSQQYHYYYRGDQVPLELNTEYAYLLLEGVQSPTELQPLIGKAKVTDFQVYNPVQTLAEMPGSVYHQNRYWAEIKFAKNMRPNAYAKQLAALTENQQVLYAGPYFSKGEDLKIGLSDLFLVKLKALGDPQILLDMAAQAGAEVVGRNRFMSDWYTLSVTPKANGNAMDLANAFFESGRFAAVEPDLMVDDLTECVNDPFFNNQWSHNNTGQWGTSAGPDINSCAGWANWGTGNIGTIVAVLDHGFERNHPDLVGNNVGNGFDSESGTTPALVLGSHGTACAGVVAATRNNNIGVTGVAPNCGIMSVSNSLAGSPNSRQKRADGINWAWQNGAAVISNSWVSGVQYQVIDDAITNALANGRGGLGTVIVFAAGNGNSNNVRYPANSNPDIIAVGAAAPCGERKNPSSCDGENWWGGDYGTQLDVAAPGVKIPTTDRQGAAGYTSTDYTQTFNGTSSACPAVAGLAGLIISLNPCLTHLQVA